jgi:quinol-cytochrome oxidoreductase complex cytochrome b subunit
MQATLALLICLAAIFVFFSQEFISTFKRVFAIKGAKLILPLAAGSWLIYSFNMEFLWLIIYIREALQKILMILVKLIPAHQYATSLALVVMLTILSVVPVYIMDWINRRRNHKAYRYPYLTSTLILIISYLLLMV